MAKKGGIIERITETFMPGDREPGETAPADDSHVKTVPVAPIQGEMDDPDPKPEPGEGEEEEFEVEIAGTVRKVDKETYELVMLERGAAEELEREVAPAPTPVVKPDEKPAFDEVAFYQDPGAMLEQIKEDAVTEATQAIGQKYAADKRQDNFWSKFYEENPKLQGEEMLVKMTLATNMQDLRKLSDGKAGRDALAEKVEGEMLRIASKQRGHKKPDDSTRLEGGSAITPPTPESSDADATLQPGQRPPSMGDELKARKIRRDRARRGEPSTQLS